MKTKINFIFISMKKNILPFLFCLFTLCLVLFSKQNLTATKNGLVLWANSVVPALLPFFIATELLSHTTVVSYLGKLLNKWMKPIFHVPGIGAYAFLMGIISGYPVGAKIVTQFRQEGSCSKAECERLLAFTNNSGPLFIIGTVGISLFGDTRTGLLLFIIHLISCILVGVCFRFWKYHNTEKVSVCSSKRMETSNVTFSNLGSVLSESILNAIHTIIVIGGFIVLFSVILAILSSSGILTLFANFLEPFFSFLGISGNFSSAILSGMLELTNGVKEVCAISSKYLSTNIIITSFLLGFGGISVLLQVLSIISKTDISIKSYLIGKLLHGSFAAMITAVIIHHSTFFNLDLVPIFSSQVDTLPSTASFSSIILLTSIFLLCTLCFRLLFSKKHKNWN